MDIRKMGEWFESEDGEKYISDFIERRNRIQNIKNKQFERLNNFGNFELFIENVISKYESKQYKDRFYNRGVVPPCDLFWFLFEYAEKYGRCCDEKEWKTYSNKFTSALFFRNGYIFHKMDGQGSVIEILKRI